MGESSERRNLEGLIVGDIVVLALVTLSGFARHGTLDSAGARMLATFIPLLAGWLAVGPLFGLYNLETISQPTQLWRPFWAAVVCVPLAGVLRGAWLNAPVLPVFVVVLGGITSIAMFAWRLAYRFFFIRRRAA